MILLTDEQSKAVAEVARTTRTALEAFQGAGAAVVYGPVGQVAKALLGLAGGDWVQEVQIRNLASLQDRTRRKVEAIAADRISEPSLSVIGPLLEVASKESRGELQDMWSALLANSMVDGGKRVRRDYFEALAKMEPIDALVLEITSWLPEGPSEVRTAFFMKEIGGRSIPRNEATIAVQNLERLGCVSRTAMAPLTPVMMPFGSGLLEACHGP